MKKACILLITLTTFCLASNFTKEANAIIEAKRVGKPLPILSINEPELTEKEAYTIQKKYIATHIKKGETVGAFKAALTSKAAQQKFGVHKPLFGIIFHSGEKTTATTLPQKGKLFIETEVGFTLKKDISKPLSTVAELQYLTDSIFAVIELPHLFYSDMKKLKGVDLIASNIAAHHYIIGEKKAISPDILDSIHVTLSYDENVINQGKTDLTQWQTLLWLINALIAEGYTIPKATPLLTGSLGKMIPAQKGMYRATYKVLEDIIFVIE